MKYSVFGMPPSQDIFTRVLLTKTIGALLLSFRCSPFLLCFTINSSIHRKNYSQQEHSFLSTIIVCLLISIPHSGSRSGIGILVLTLACFIYVFPYQNKEIRKEIELDDSHSFYCIFISYNFVFPLPESRYHQGNADQHQKPNYRGIESATSHESCYGPTWSIKLATKRSGDTDLIPTPPSIRYINPKRYEKKVHWSG